MKAEEIEQLFDDVFEALPSGSEVETRWIKFQELLSSNPNDEDHIRILIGPKGVCNGCGQRAEVYCGYCNPDE